jgi:hypothetical protein
VESRRKCVVSFRDGDGVEHVAEVTAESLYKAGAFASQAQLLMEKI